MAKKPEAVKPEKELAEIARLAARYAVADPGKDARDALFRRMAALGKK